ncbi:cupin domain-containing protein [Neptuniibacter halophilus]|uniref:cupin domain-containing protein n=1 Tax=Neptuniibacter halophilus TaxID=651666 RepID=UPI0025735B37|nr:cupin domain-containing protein [Neptuniibacter halophilus]
MVSHVVAFDSIPLSTGIRSAASAEVMLEGNPETTTWPVFTSTDSKLSVGFWECEPYRKIKQSPDKVEFVHLLEGEVRLTDNTGNSSLFKAGDAFVIAPGFDGVWESIGKVRKQYVIYE